MPTEKVVVLVALQLAEVVVIGVEVVVLVVVVAQLVGVALVVAGVVVVVGRPVVGLMLLLLLAVGAAGVPSAASAAFVLVGIVSFTERTIPCSGWTSCRGAATAAPVLSRYST